MKSSTHAQTGGIESYRAGGREAHASPTVVRLWNIQDKGALRGGTAVSRRGVLGSEYYMLLGEHQPSLSFTDEGDSKYFT